MPVGGRRIGAQARSETGQKHTGIVSPSALAHAVAQAGLETDEIDLWHTSSEFYSYHFFVMRVR
jgi:hypothetical protein